MISGLATNPISIATDPSGHYLYALGGQREP